MSLRLQNAKKRAEIRFSEEDVFVSRGRVWSRGKGNRIMKSFKHTKRRDGGLTQIISSREKAKQSKWLLEAEFGRPPRGPGDAGGCSRLWDACG